MYKTIQIISMTVMMLFLPQSIALGNCQDDRLPVADRKLVKLKGSVANVKMGLGRGLGYFTLKTPEDREFRIRMGPVPFLLQTGFNLSVGNEAEIQGIQINEELVPPLILAIEVKNLTSHKTIRLRDQQMRPMWCCRRGHASSYD